jgi:hypothetical protein
VQRNTTTAFCSLKKCPYDGKYVYRIAKLRKKCESLMPQSTHIFQAENGEGATHFRLHLYSCVYNSWFLNTTMQTHSVTGFRWGGGGRGWTLPAQYQKFITFTTSLTPWCLWVDKNQPQNQTFTKLLAIQHVKWTPIIISIAIRHDPEAGEFDPYFKNKLPSTDRHFDITLSLTSLYSK